MHPSTSKGSLGASGCRRWRVTWGPDLVVACITGGYPYMKKGMEAEMIQFVSPKLEDDSSLNNVWAKDKRGSRASAISRGGGGGRGEGNAPRKRLHLFAGGNTISSL